MTDQEKNEIFLRNEKLIYWYLKKHKLLFMLDELYYIACIGLVRGINSFDKTVGVKETTFFVKCISSSIGRYFQLQSLPKRNPKCKILSLDEPIIEFDNLTFKDVIPDLRESVEERVEINELREILNKAIDTLPEAEKDVILRYFGINRKNQNIVEIAKDLNLSRAAISARKIKAINKLKKELIKMKYIDSNFKL